MKPARERPTGFRVELRPSRTQRLLVLSIHALATTGLCLSALPYWARWGGLVLVFASFIWQIRESGPSVGGSRIQSLGVNAEGTWTIESARESYPARLLASSQLWVTALFLRFDIDGRNVRVMLTPDSIRREDFRRLQAHLRAYSAS